MSSSWADIDSFRMTLSLRPYSSCCFFPPSVLFPMYAEENIFPSSMFCPALPAQVRIWGLCLLSSIYVSLEWKFPQEHLSKGDIDHLHQFLPRHLTKNAYSRNSLQIYYVKHLGDGTQKFPSLRFFSRHPLCVLKLENHDPIVRIYVLCCHGQMHSRASYHHMPSDLQGEVPPEGVVFKFGWVGK